MKSWALNGGCDLMGSSDGLVDMISVMDLLLLALRVTSCDSARLGTQCCVPCMCATPFRPLHGH